MWWIGVQPVFYRPLDENCQFLDALSMVMCDQVVFEKYLCEVAAPGVVSWLAHLSPPLASY